MAHAFAPYDRDQQFLMPPSVIDWLPDDHLAFFVLEIVDQLDLAAFHARYRLGGAGRAAYDPKVLLGVMLYGYCVGERSSRALERRCVEDVAFRVVAANQAPDHATIARFRAEHEQAIAELFSQGLALCAKAGLVKVGIVAIDGTKIAASASGSANRTAEAIEALVDRMLQEAKAVDEAEDALNGDKRGDELPAEFARREGRAQRLRELKAELDAEDAQRRAEVRAHNDRASETLPRRGPRPRPKDPDAIKKATVNTTDPDSRIMKCNQGYLQGYNAQIAVTEDQIVIAAEVTQDASDSMQLRPMVAAAVEGLQAAEVTAPVGTVLADAGYFSERNVSAGLGPELLIPPVSQKAIRAGARPADPSTHPNAAVIAAEHAETARRERIIKRWDAGDIDYRGAALELRLSVPATYAARDRYRRLGVEGLLNRRTPKLPEPTHRDLMLAKILEEPGKSLYAKRSHTVEPVFGQIKEIRGIRRFMRRGVGAAESEWKLVGMTHNLLKLWRSGWSPLRPAAT